jgi:hypothetical protein
MFSAAGFAAVNRFATPYAEDVFGATAYTGNGGVQTVGAGPDLLAKGGLVWIKSRSAVADNILIDTVRGAGNYATTDTTAAQAASAFNLSVANNGFSVNTASAAVNANGATYVGWQFRKAAKFFDVVVWTGNGATQAVPHALGVAPGMIIAKRLDGAGDWVTYNRSLASADYLSLNTTATKANSASVWGNNTAGVAPTSTAFTLGSDAAVNAAGGSYVAYVFAHDTTTDGLIQCGSYTGNGAATGPAVTLGWEPQFLLVKPASAVGAWSVIDYARGFGALGTDDAVLSPGASAAELALAKNVSPSATGFQVDTTAATFNTSGATYVYMAIRRPGKVPTSAAQVYSAIARTGTGATAKVTGVGFAPDLVITKNRGAAAVWRFHDKARAPLLGLTVDTAIETSVAGSVTSFDSDGVTLGSSAPSNANGAALVNYFLRRCPKVFDVMSWTGDGSGGTRQIPHNLKAVPEMIIAKTRTTVGDWQVSTPNNRLFLNTTAGQSGTAGNSSYVDVTYFKPLATASADSNAAGVNYVAYLFATLAGISKVFSYTGDGASQAIACGFAGGARFVMIKRTDAVGDWYLFDVARGIAAGNDPHLSVNTTAAEVATDDSIDTDPSGFIVNQVAATNLNVSGATYVGLAFA